MEEYLSLKLPDERYAFSYRNDYPTDATSLLTHEDIRLIVDQELKAIKAKAWKSAIRRPRRKH